ncbi:CLUMA_CG006252, isoform A [Clunio marinus]|uniref:CLUMA_CG006252, isoform A n=1 Tax=Clunio marinus TaxID=568069 RepID=A0A1J1HZB5_9DIPT|nr:CLUMA_CG006252, isoform A [Clunio marinus]
MKRVQPTVVHSQSQHTVRRMIQQRDNTQMSAVNKINNLPSVSVSTQPRYVRQTIYSGVNAHKCFICDENILGQATNLTESETITSREKVTKKLAKMVGDDFCVIVSEEDKICRRCITLFNTMDKYEFDLENVKSRLRTFIKKKYGIDDEEPPLKIQKLNSGSPSYNRWQNNTEKTTAVAAENQLKNLSSSNVSPAARRGTGPVKLYKCIACDFKTTDLSQFQPHSNECKGQSNKTQSTLQNRIVRQAYNSPTQKQNQNATEKQQQKVGGTTIVRNNIPQSQIQCRICAFKTTDRALFQEHQRNHMKNRPFKCRMCLERFETREAAQIHAKIHQTNTTGQTSWQCSVCTRQFSKRDLFEAHMKTHEKFKTISQQEVIVMNKNDKNTATIQKPLTDIIKEALSEDDQDTVNELIEFHSCNLCSLTFVNKKLYAQHMKTHDKSNEGARTTYTKTKQQDTLGDLESIFEKMHSENVHHTVASNGGLSDKNVLITTQEGGITYNITIPQDDVPEVVEVDEEQKQNVRIDMPNLDDPNEAQEKTDVHVSMPSLSADDEENTQSSQEQTEVQGTENSGAIPMELEDLQNASGNGQQLKFIVDENGQFLQLDNHILTTDAEGNQILVQGTDQEQLQHLLQSVGVDGNQVLVQLQGNGEGIDGEGTTLQMLGDGNQGQMILVQGADGESQLIDASMLQTEGGNLVLQQDADGETHLTTADGIPVSVSFTGEGGDGQITVTMASAGQEGEGQQIFIQQPMELGEDQESETPAEFSSQNQEETTQQTNTADPLAEQSQDDQSEATSNAKVTSTTEESKKTPTKDDDATNKESSQVDEVKGEDYKTDVKDSKQDEKGEEVEKVKL